MARPSSKNREEILDACRDLFWEKGYKKTAIKDIEIATQLKNGSIYHFFSNKNDLFEQTLDHYIITIMQPRFNRYLFTDNGCGYENIRNFFLSNLVVKLKDRHGCLMVNTTHETGLNPVTKKKLDQITKLLERGFLYQLQRIKELNSFSQEKKQNIAKSLTISNQGFFSILKLGKNNRELKSYIDGILLIIRY